MKNNELLFLSLNYDTPCITDLEILACRVNRTVIELNIISVTIG